MSDVKKKSWKRPVLIVLFVLLNVAVIAATAVAEFGKSNEAAELSEIKFNWWMLVPAVVCFLVAVMIDIHKYALMIREMMPKGKSLDEIGRAHV